MLVVDDNQDAAETLAALLRVSGCEVHIATDPYAGLALLEEFAPEVTILDIGPPRIDGYGLAARIRATEIGRSCRLIAFTGYGMAEDRARTRAAGFDAHLVKPVDLDALFACCYGETDQRVRRGSLLPRSSAPERALPA